MTVQNWLVGLMIKFSSTAGCLRMSAISNFSYDMRQQSCCPHRRMTSTVWAYQARESLAIQQEHGKSEDS